MRPFTPSGPFDGGRPVLHVYVRPGTAVRAALAHYQEHVPDPSAYGVAWQPAEQAHLTVLRVDARPEQVDVARLHRHLAQGIPGGEIDARLMRVGPPLVGERAVEAWIEPSPAWAPLVLHARSAAISAGLAEQRLHPSPRPHLALGYGTGDGDSGVLSDALKQVRMQHVEFEVQELHLAAVHYTAAGTFAWETLGRIPLGHPGPRPGLQPPRPPQAPGGLNLD